MALRTQLRMGKPTGRELVAAVRHVLAAEHAKAQHLHWREFRFEPGREMASHRLGPVVDISTLHAVVDDDLPCHDVVNTFVMEAANIHDEVLDRFPPWPRANRTFSFAKVRSSTIRATPGA